MNFDEEKEKELFVSLLVLKKNKEFLLNFFLKKIIIKIKWDEINLLLWLNWYWKENKEKII